MFLYLAGDASASTYFGGEEMGDMETRQGPKDIAAHHIKLLTPKAKIIMMIRDPVERLYSHYAMLTKSKINIHKFHHYVNESIAHFKACVSKYSVRGCIYESASRTECPHPITRGLYAIVLKDWLSVFPDNQIGVIYLEDYIKNKRQTLRKTYQFLGLRQLSKAKEDEVVKDMQNIANKGKKREDMLPETRVLLENFYKPYNKQLRRILKKHDILLSGAHPCSYKIQLNIGKNYIF